MTLRQSAKDVIGWDKQKTNGVYLLVQRKSIGEHTGLYWYRQKKEWTERERYIKHKYGDKREECNRQDVRNIIREEKKE